MSLGEMIHNLSSSEYVKLEMITDITTDIVKYVQLTATNGYWRLLTVSSR